MKRRRLGRTAVEVPEFGFGSGPIGGLYRVIDEETGVGALRAAWEGGVRYFDTAPFYGIGQAERFTGAMLADHDRSEYVLSTKVGRVLIPHHAAGRMDESFHVPATHRIEWDFSRDGVRRSLDDSLERLGVEQVDVLLLHEAEQRWEQALAEGLPALVELRDEGVVGAIGAGMGYTAELAQLVREYDVDVVMLAGRYTLLDQSALDELLPACVERGISLLAAAPFNSGVLATHRTPDDAYFDYGAAPPEILVKARAIAAVCDAFGVTLPQVALAFPLTHPAVSAVVAGMETAAQVADNLAAFGADVPHGLWRALADAGLLDERVPLT